MVCTFAKIKVQTPKKLKTNGGGRHPEVCTFSGSKVQKCRPKSADLKALVFNPLPFKSALSALFFIKKEYIGIAEKDGYHRPFLKRPQKCRPTMENIVSLRSCLAYYILLHLFKR